MRRTAAVLMATFLAMAQMPAFGAEQRKTDGKDTCILNSQNCPCQKLTIQQKIDRLQGEIDKGTTVYTRDELQHLRYKLNEARATLDILMYNHATRNFD